MTATPEPKPWTAEDQAAKNRRAFLMSVCTSDEMVRDVFQLPPDNPQR